MQQAPHQHFHATHVSLYPLFTRTNPSFFAHCCPRVVLSHPPAEVGGRGVMLSTLASTAAAAPAPPEHPRCCLCRGGAAGESRCSVQMHPPLQTGVCQLLTRQDLCETWLPVWVPGLRAGERARCPQHRCPRKLCPWFGRVCWS